MKKIYYTLWLFVALSSFNLYPMGLSELVLHASFANAQNILNRYIERITHFKNKKSGIIITAALVAAVAITRKIYLTYHHAAVLQRQQSIIARANQQSEELEKREALQEALAAEVHYKQAAGILNEKIRVAQNKINEILQRKIPTTGGYAGYVLIPLQQRNDHATSLAESVKEYEKQHDWTQALSCKKQILALLEQPSNRVTL